MATKRYVQFFLSVCRYYPLIQELSYIRPVRFLSPNAFVNGATTSPITHNSCPTGWNGGNVGEPIPCHTGAPTGCVPITCTGIKAGTAGIVGTGPFKFISRTKATTTATADGDPDAIVNLAKHTQYWGGAPQVDLQIVRYETAAAVAAALKDGSLDAVVGAGVLAPTDLQAFQYDNTFDVRHTEVVLNNVVILKIDDLQVRKTVIHAVDKNRIIKTQLGGQETPVSQLFQTSAPYCNVDLTPKFDYDFEKATLINCPNVTALPEESQPDQSLPNFFGECFLFLIYSNFFFFF